MKLQMRSLALLLMAAVVLNGCKKDDDTETLTPEMEQTLDLSEKQAITDSDLEDANDIFMEAAAENDLLGHRTAQSLEPRNTLNCATVTVSPLIGFPKTIVIDFGTGCTDPRGVIRSGIINVVVSDSLRLPGTTAVMTFANYIVQGRKIEGTITWTNTSTPPTRYSWQREVVNGKVTRNNGNDSTYWTYNGLKEVVHAVGANTPFQLADDEFVITGNNTVAHSLGYSRTSTITNPLHKKRSCANIDEGTIRIDAPNHYALLDFGDGTCDRNATISINGGPAHNILLRP